MTLKKMSAKDIKRQDHIWELIQTEKSHCQTLKIMQKVFSAGMLSEVHLQQEMVNRIFPQLPELVEVHTSFVHRLTELQSLKADRSIDSIGPLLIQQFDGEYGHRLKNAYGEFCSGHIEAVQLYKDLLKSDRKFQAFIKKCSRNNVCKRRGIPECILLVTQRMTKYPLLIEPIIKTTKEPRAERESLTRALALARNILIYVDAQVDAREKKQRLFEIFHNLDARSSAQYKNQKFKKSHLLSNNRKLLHEGTIKWMSARGKTIEVQAVILSDLIFFLSENNQKYSFFSQDNKSSVVSLSKLIVREKGDTRDSKGLYLICQSADAPEMYELVCRSAEERKAWIATIRNAIANCPDEEEGSTVESEEERKVLEARSAKLRQLIDQLHQRDQVIHQTCDMKMKTILEMLEVFGYDDIGANLRAVYRDKEGQELPELEKLLQATLKEASSLAIMLQGGSTNLSRSVSSAGEHESSSYVMPPLPKRAETFSGFEAKEKDILKRRHASGHHPADEGSSPDVSMSSHTTSPSPSRERNGNDSLLNVDGGTGKVTRRSSIGLPGSESSGKSTSNKEWDSIQSAYLQNLSIIGEDSSDVDRISRRMSTSFLQHLLTKQGGDRDETDSRTDSRASSDQGSVGDLSSASSGVTMLSLNPPPRDQCASLVQLIQYIHSIVTVASQQHTESESFKAKLAEANAKISCLNAESERPGDKKSMYQHDKQLEELRNLQEAFNQERQGWYKVREREREFIDAEKAEILKETNAQKEVFQREREMWQQTCEEQRSRFEEAQKAFLDKMEKDKMELKRQKEVLQRQIDLFEQQKVHAQQSPSALHTSGITDSPKMSRVAKPGSPSQSKVAPPASVPQTMWDNVVHKRSASDDLYRGPLTEEGFTPIPAEYSNSLKEPLNMAQLRKSPVNPPPPVSREPTVPLHLLSRTNEQKIGPMASQRLPLKLATGSSSRSQSTSSLPQKLPLKLASHSSVPLAAPAASPPTSRAASKHQPRWGDTRSTAQPVTAPVHHTSRLSGSQSQPHLGHTRVLSGGAETHSILPMKLAEKRPKSASPSPQSQLPPSGQHQQYPDQSHPRHSQKLGRDEPEVMYF